MTQTQQGLSRRDMLKALGLGAMGFGLLNMNSGTVRAQISPTQQDVAAYFKFALGDFQMTVITDNALQLPANFFGVNQEAQTVVDFLAARGVLNTADDQPTAPASVLNLVMQNGDDTFIFDTGTGNRLLPTLGALGIAPESVTGLLMSHLHGDHVGGVSRDGVLNFPSATIYFPEAEFTFLNEGPEGVTAAAQNALAPALAEDGRIELFNGGDEVVPGVTAVATPGHTPGHTAWLIENNGSSLIHFVDAVASAYVSPVNTDWHFGFDFEPEQAVESRRMILGMAADMGAQVMGYHFPFPGLGYVVADGENAWQYVPAAF